MVLTFYEAEIDPFRSVGLYKLLHPIRYQSKKNSQFYLIESGNFLDKYDLSKVIILIDYLIGSRLKVKIKIVRVPINQLE